jgi:uncharacterized protein (TIGR02599 family)
MTIYSLQELAGAGDGTRWATGGAHRSMRCAGGSRRLDGGVAGAAGPRRHARGFTLVELLVSTAVIALIMLMLVQVTNNISNAWRGTAEKVEKFQGARDGFEAMTRRISQATLNTYWDYYDISGVTRSQYTGTTAFLPFTYGRQSDLRFICGPMSGATWSITANSTLAGSSLLNYWPTHGIFFPAPLGVVLNTTQSPDQQIYGAMDNLLNTWGYFVEINSDANPNLNIRPPFITNANTQAQRWRARLMEFEEPTENMCTYDVSYVPSTPANPILTQRDWFEHSLGITTSSRPVRVMAENVLALIFLPKLSTVDENARQAQGYTGVLAPEYTYDSTTAPPTANQGTAPTVGSTHNPCSGSMNPSTNTLDASGVDPRNQLPPEIQVIMIAIDERSAQRLIDLTNAGASLPTRSSTSLSDPTLGGIYSSGGTQLFTTALTGSPNNYTNQLGNAETANTDLYMFTQALVSMKLTYRIFATDVTIRGAKWSRAQTD